MDLREDEIEALLKFHGAKLDVATLTNDLFGGDLAVITCADGKHFSRESQSRIDAVREVWQVFNTYVNAVNTEAPKWYREDASTGIELRMIYNAAIERNEKGKLK